MARLMSWSWKRSVTSPISETKTKARIFVKASCRLYMNCSMKRETLATEDETSQRMTSFGRSLRRSLKTNSKGTPPRAMLRRSIVWRSSLPRLRRRRRIGQHVLHALRQAVHHLAHPHDLVLGEAVEALLEERLAPEFLHVVEVARLELALDEVRERSAAAPQRSAPPSCPEPRRRHPPSPTRASARRGLGARPVAASAPSCSMVRRVKNPIWSMFWMRSAPAASAAARIIASRVSRSACEKRLGDLGHIEITGLARAGRSWSCSCRLPSSTR